MLLPMQKLMAEVDNPNRLGEQWLRFCQALSHLDMEQDKGVTYRNHNQDSKSILRNIWRSELQTWNNVKSQCPSLAHYSSHMQIC